MNSFADVKIIAGSLYLIGNVRRLVTDSNAIDDFDS